MAEGAGRSRWLGFNDVTRDGAKTRTVEVWSIRGARLGVIKWFGRWRQYAFFPSPETVFNPECLRDIQYEIGDLMALRKSLTPQARGGDG